MKKKGKKIFLFTLSAVLLCGLVVGLYHLFFKTDPFELAKLNISEKGTCFFVDATNENVNLKVSSGLRESPYNLDGKHNKMKPYTLLIFQTNIKNISTPSFSAKIDGVDYSGVLELNPCDNTYVVDLEVLLRNDSTIEVVIKIEDNDFTFKPSNLNLGWALSFDEAFKVGLNHLKDVVNKLVQSREFLGECYCKVISDPSGVLNIYYYYVGIVDVNGNIYSVIIDTSNGNILSK